MTAKRFIQVIGGVKDTRTGRVFTHSLEITLKLNEINDLYDCVFNRNEHLEEENEQLKQRNDRQAKQLDRLYHLISEKDWRTLTDILDDFKRCEEQLQRESGTYGDLE